MTSSFKDPSNSDQRADPFRSLKRPLLVGSFVAAMVFLFLKLATFVTHGKPADFDQAILLQAQAFRADHPKLTEMMMDITSLGSVAVLTLFTVVIVLYLLLLGSTRTAVLVGAAMLSGTALVNTFKVLLGRARPDQAFAELTVSGMSFPSGHTSMSAVAFLTTGALFAAIHHRADQRIFILLIAGILTLMVGLSRIALGVHWTTDVIGGWAFGAAWAVVWLQVARVFVKR